MSEFKLPDRPIIIKVGGSLLTMRGLGDRLGRFLKLLGLRDLVLVPGGGGVVSALRELDKAQEIGELQSHWLALRGMTVNAYVLRALLADFPSEVVGSCQRIKILGKESTLAILDGFSFAAEDDQDPNRLPSRWAVTSDAVAARLAVLLEASEIILLKSVDFDETWDWNEAVAQGYLDGFFLPVLRSGFASTPEPRLRWINFLKW